MTYYGIFIKGLLDCDPEPMIFRTYTGAVEFLNGCHVYDPDKTEVLPMHDYQAERILEEYGTEAGE